MPFIDSSEGSPFWLADHGQADQISQADAQDLVEKLRDLDGHGGLTQHCWAELQSQAAGPVVMVPGDSGTPPPADAQLPGNFISPPAPAGPDVVEVPGDSAQPVQTPAAAQPPQEFEGDAIGPDGELHPLTGAPDGPEALTGGELRGLQPYRDVDEEDDEEDAYDLGLTNRTPRRWRWAVPGLAGLVILAGGGTYALTRPARDASAPVATPALGTAVSNAPAAAATPSPTAAGLGYLPHFSVTSVTEGPPQFGGPGTCGAADMTVVVSDIDGPALRQDAAGHRLTVKVTTSPSGGPLDGTTATQTVGADGSATFVFPSVKIISGMQWTVTPVALDGAPVSQDNPPMPFDRGTCSH